MGNNQLTEFLASMRDSLAQITYEIHTIKGYFESEWVPISEVALIHGITRQAVQKKINNGLIDPSKETRWEGNRLMIRRSAVQKLKSRNTFKYAA